jgi:predicted MFS family arabinose efflux permease
METSVLRSGPLRALLAAEVISTTGMQMTWLALPWFVLITTDSPTQMTGVMAAELLGFAVAGLPAGPLIQRLGARRTMLYADALRTPLMLLVPLLHWSGHLVYGELLLLALLLGVVGAPHFTAQRVILPELIGEDEVRMSQANALFQGAIRTTLFLGPPLGGLLIGVLDAASVLVIDAGTYVVSFLLVALFVPGRETTPETEEARGILAGLRFLRREPLLRVWIPLFVVGDAGWQAFFAAVPVLTVERFSADARIAGVLFAAFGGGALVGNFASYRYLATRVEGLRLIAFSVPFQALPLWILPLDVGPGVMFAAVLASGVANGVCNPSIHAIWTLRMPAAIRPKAMAASGTIWGLGMPVGLLVAGPILSVFGARPVLVGFAAVQTLCMLAVAAVSLKAASPALHEAAESPS